MQPLLWDLSPLDLSQQPLSEDELLSSHMGESNEDSSSYNLITLLEEAEQELVPRAGDGR